MSPDPNHTIFLPSLRSRVSGAVLGALAGDALGVPFEFTSRVQRECDPVTGMRGFGTWNQPPGTWSDDGALLLSSVESLLTAPGDIDAAGTNFVRWLREGRWAARGVVFDVGAATRAAIVRMESGIAAVQAGGTAESDNGNGSLMRILPVALHYWREPVAVVAQEAMRWSSLTHRHPRSQLACACYSSVVQELLREASPAGAVLGAARVLDHLLEPFPHERPHFRRILDGSLTSASSAEIRSGGYVIETLETALWCLLPGGSLAEIVLRAVNLGGDTDTSGCVTGGLAGAWLGESAIPSDWITTIRSDSAASDLIQRFALALDP